jgi:hypothetical protein
MAIPTSGSISFSDFHYEPPPSNPAQGRIVLFYFPSGTSYRGDFQVEKFRKQDSFSPQSFSDMWTFEADNDGWEGCVSNDTNITNAQANYDTLPFTSILNGTSTHRWNRDSYGTGSGGTGISMNTWGIYAETSSGSNKCFIARSPSFDLGALASTGAPSYLRSMEAYFGMYGSNIGTVYVYHYSDDGTSIESLNTRSGSTTSLVVVDLMIDFLDA